MLATDNTVVQQATVAVASAIGGMVIPVNARFLPSVAMAMAISVGAAAATIGAVAAVRPTFTSPVGRAVVRLDQKLLDSPNTHAATMTAAIMGGMSAPSIYSAFRPLTRGMRVGLPLLAFVPLGIMLGTQMT